MPTYDYRCAKCGEDLEVYQTFSEAPLTRHKGCGGKLTKVLSPAGIVLKGSGFYKTDNRSAAKRSDGKGPDAKSKEAGSGTNGDSTKSTDSKGADSKSSTDSKPSTTSSSSDSKKPAAKSA